MPIGPYFLALLLAGNSPEPADDELPAEVETRDAEAIFRRGQAQYETADYVGAIESWTQAYGLVESTPENAAIQALLIFNLAQAHVKAYELDDDDVHLKQARALLESYRDSLHLLYEDDAARADESAKVDQRIDEIQAMIDARSEPVPDSHPEPRPAVPPPTRVDVGPAPKPGNPMLFAGIGVLAAGALGGGALVGVGAAMGANANDLDALDPVDLAARESQFTRGRTGNTLVVAGAVVAGVLVPTGAALIAVGARRNAKARSVRTVALPSFGPRGAGLTLTGRF